MPDKKKSIKEILTELREDKTAALNKKSKNFGVRAGTIAAIFAGQLNKRFDRMEKNGDFPYFTIRRKDIRNYLGPKAVEDKRGQPSIKQYIRERLRGYGISAYHKGGFVEFKRIKPKKNPQV